MAAGTQKGGIAGLSLAGWLPCRLQGPGKCAPFPSTESRTIREAGWPLVTGTAEADRPWGRRLSERKGSSGARGPDGLDRVQAEAEAAGPPEGRAGRLWVPPVRTGPHRPGVLAWQGGHGRQGRGMFCVCRAGPWTGQGPVDLLPGRSKLPGPSQAHSPPPLPRGRGPDLGPRGWAATPPELTWVSWDRQGPASLVCDPLPPRGGCPVRPAGASGGDVSAPDLPRFPPS